MKYSLTDIHLINYIIFGLKENKTAEIYAYYLHNKYTFKKKD